MKCCIVLACIALFLTIASPVMVQQMDEWVLPTNSVYTIFTVYYPDQHLVTPEVLFLRGDACNLTWNKGHPLTRNAKNEWQLSLLCPQNKTISVKALLNDSFWSFGQNTVFNGDRQVKLYPCFNPSANQIKDNSIASSILNNSRKVSIYHPPSYFDNTLKQYEVLIMQDGQNLFLNSQAAFGVAWGIQNTINQLTAQGSIREIIVVGVWNTRDRNNEYTYSVDPEEGFGGKGDHYLDFIEKELIPTLRNSWLEGRIDGKLAIGGSSLGGLISCYATYTRPTVFPTSICMSSSFWWNQQDFNSKVLYSGKLYPSVKFYLDSGDSGPSQDSMNQTLHVFEHFSSIGYKPNQSVFHYVDEGGQHNEYYWGHRFHLPLTYLYR